MGDRLRQGLGPACLLVGLLMVLGACNEPLEACLDIQAANYDVEADVPCPDCCMYPEFRVDIQHKVAQGDTTVNLLLDSLAYRDASGRRFGLLSVKYYLSKLHLRRADGGTVRSFDTLLLRFPQAPGDTTFIPVENSFALADPAAFRQRRMGVFRGEGQMEGMRVLLGLQDTSSAANPAFMPEDHPLADEEMYLDSDMRHIFTRLEVFTLSEPADTTRTVLRVRGAESLRALDFPASFYLDPGFSPRFLLEVDYGQWFRVIDLDGKSVAEMEADLLDVMPGSIDLLSVTTSLN